MDSMWIFPLLLVSLVIPVVEASETNLLRRYNMTQSMLGDGYNARVWPGWYMGSPTKVSLQLVFQDMWNIDQKQGTYKTDIYLRAGWIDQRLARNVSDSPQLPTALDCTPFFHELWRPDLYVTNQIEHEPEEKKELCELYESGLIFWVRRSVATMRCNMDFTNLPFDSQSCSIIVEDYHHRVNEVVLEFAEPGTEGVGNLKSAEWGNFRVSQQTSKGISRLPFTFSRAHVILTMDRQRMEWWLTVIMPCILFVVISYLGLWIDPQALPARISLDVICILITVTLIQRVSEQLPRVSYPVWITVYMSGCLVFNFATLIGFCAARYSHRKISDTKKKMVQADLALIEEGQKQPSAEGDRTADDALERMSVSKRMSDLAWVKAARCLSHVDKFMRVAHPLAFLVFNIICFASLGSWRA